MRFCELVFVIFCLINSKKIEILCYYRYATLQLNLEKKKLVSQMPKLKALPKSLRLEHAICIELKEGVPVFKASSGIQSRIEKLLRKQKN